VLFGFRGQSSNVSHSHPEIWVPAQTPAVQTSFWVQPLPSSQVVPSAATGSVQAPVAGSHVPAARHWPDATQVGVTTSGPWVQTPAWQVSWVQRFPVSQATPSAWFV
jgi:hypothetical protein